MCCSYVFDAVTANERSYRCPHPATTTCPKCEGEYCFNHAARHGCVEIIEPKGNATMQSEDVQARTLEFLSTCKELGYVGIVVLVGEDMQPEIIGHGIDAGNAAEVLRQLAGAVDASPVNTLAELDVRPAVAN